MNTHSFGAWSGGLVSLLVPDHQERVFVSGLGLGESGAGDLLSLACLGKRPHSFPSSMHIPKQKPSTRYENMRKPYTQI